MNNAHQKAHASCTFPLTTCSYQTENVFTPMIYNDAWTVKKIKGKEPRQRKKK